jgi:uncharacterized protein (TIGR02147 family)
MDYRQLLHKKYYERKQRNHSYSIRAFARDLSMSPAHLSEILAAKANLSIASAKTVSRKMYRTPTEAQYFCDLVAIESSDDQMASEARRRLGSGKASPLTCDVSPEAFVPISEWYYYAIIDSLHMSHIRSDQELAKFLNLERETVQFALKKLMTANLIERDPNTDNWYRPVQFRVDTMSPAPAVALRRYHEQLIQKAKVAVKEQTSDERSLNSMTLVFDPSRYQEAAADLRTFAQEFQNKYSMDDAKTLYALTMQFFKLGESRDQSTH